MQACYPRPQPPADLKTQDMHKAGASLLPPFSLRMFPAGYSGITTTIDIIDVHYADMSPLVCQGGDTRLYVERTGDEARIIGHHLIAIDCLGHGTNDRIEPTLAMKQLSQYRGARPENDAEGSCQFDVCLNLPRCFHRIAVPVNELSTTVPCVGAEETCQA